MKALNNDQFQVNDIYELGEGLSFSSFFALWFGINTA